MWSEIKIGEGFLKNFGNLWSFSIDFSELNLRIHEFYILPRFLDKFVQFFYKSCQSLQSKMFLYIFYRPTYFNIFL